MGLDRNYSSLIGVFRAMMRFWLALLGIVLALQPPAYTVDPLQNVDIGGRTLYLNCSGPTSFPTVILESGSGGTSDAWNRVQPEVAKFAHVCSYDRAGIGKSPAADHQHSADEHVADLHALLQKAGIKPPYILVGHSLGGLLVRKYQTQFSQEVVGLVLLDSAHEEQLVRYKDIPGALAGPPADPANWPTNGFLTPGQHLQWHTDIPLIVIEHGRPMDLPPGASAQAARLEQIMHALQQDLASRSSKGELRQAKESGHDIPEEQPQAVIQAIRDVMSRTK